MNKIDNFGEKVNTQGFDKHPENIGKGRNKKIYTILKEKGYSADDIRIAFNEIAFYDINELETIQNDETNPIITRILAKVFKESFKNANWSYIKEIIDQVIGKATQTNITELQGSETQPINIVIQGQINKDK